MPNHRRPPHADRRRETLTADHAPGTPRIVPLARAARGILVPALVAGGLAAGAAASPALAASSHQPGTLAHVPGASDPAGYHHIVGAPWMY